MGSALVVLLLATRPVLSGAEMVADDASGTFRVHYTLDGADAPLDPGDVDAVLDGVSRVRQRWVDRAGLRAPLLDGGGGGPGGDGRIDVYLRKLDGPRGYAHPEEVGRAPATS